LPGRTSHGAGGGTEQQDPDDVLHDSLLTGLESIDPDTGNR